MQIASVAAAPEPFPPSQPYPGQPGQPGQPYPPTPGYPYPGQPGVDLNEALRVAFPSDYFRQMAVNSIMRSSRPYYDSAAIVAGLGAALDNEYYRSTMLDPLLGSRYLGFELQQVLDQTGRSLENDYFAVTALNAFATARLDIPTYEAVQRYSFLINSSDNDYMATAAVQSYFR